MPASNTLKPSTFERILSAVKGLADYFLGRSKTLSWRRLVAWLSSFGLLLAGKIGEDTWLWLTVAFIGGEVIEKFSKRIQGP